MGTASSSRHGGDKRGSAATRRARKYWMLSTSAPFGGNGTEVLCVHGCMTLLTFETVEADRIQPGGPYRRENLQPSCSPCNKKRSNDPTWVLVDTQRLVI